MRGIPQSVMIANKVKSNIIFTQKRKSSSPFVEAEITASNRSTAVSVMIVPPIVMVTASLRVIPIRLAIGYEIRVCVENILARRSEDTNVK